MSLTKEAYSNYKSWKTMYPDNKVKLDYSSVKKSWKPMFDKMKDEKLCDYVDKMLSKCLAESDDSLMMHPQPELVFNAFNLTDFKNLKVVILGQDPYFNHEMCNSKKVSQAMGLSFSVPVGISIPSSLKNVYANLQKHGHLMSEPANGNLEFWAHQGVLMLNTSLTVIDGSENKNCHQYIWNKFTDYVIKYISDNCDNVMFLIWGKDAFEKMSLVDLDKHDASISSHPSGYSAATPFRTYPGFNSCDHFGKVNKMLKKWKKDPIIWQP